MKKNLCLILCATIAVAMVGCSKEKRWSEKERKELRNELSAYRDMVYLDNLAEVEYDDFAGDVVEAIEIDYPIYTAFYELPARGDTLDVYVVSMIVERLDADPHNLRNIFPYTWLVVEGIVPPGLDHQAQRAYYDCLSHKIKRHYHSSRRFLHALMNDPSAQNTITKMQMDCARDLFDWGVVQSEAIEVESQS
jgi:hypothetical protein